MRDERFYRIEPLVLEVVSLGVGLVNSASFQGATRSIG
jgi:hypothetical protein